MSPGKRERSQARFQRWRCDFLGIKNWKKLKRAEAKKAYLKKIEPLTFHQHLNKRGLTQLWKDFLKKRRATSRRDLIVEEIIWK